MTDTEKEFIRGVAYTIALHDKGVPEWGLLGESGYTIEDLRQADVPDEDIEGVIRVSK